MLLYTSYFTEYTLTMAISFDRSQGCKAKWCMGSADCCLEACYTTVLHNAWTQQLGLTHPFEVWTLAVHTWAFLSNQNRSQNFVNRIELLCTTTNYNFNQQSSISLSSGFSRLHSPQTCIPFMCCLITHSMQLSHYSSAHIHKFKMQTLLNSCSLMSLWQWTGFSSILHNQPPVLTDLYKSLSLCMYSNLFFEALLFLWHRLVWCAWHKLILK